MSDNMTNAAANAAAPKPKRPRPPLVNPPLRRRLPSSDPSFQPKEWTAPAPQRLFCGAGPIWRGYFSGKYKIPLDFPGILW